MILGIGSYAYNWAIGVPGAPPPNPMTALDLLRRASDLGVHVLQLADNVPLHTRSEAELEALQRYAEARAFRIEVGTRGIEPEHLNTYLDLARRFGSGILRLVVDTADRQPDEEAVFQALRPLMPAFEAAHVCLAIENHDRFPARSLARLMERLDSPMAGICLDTANSFGVQEGIRTVVETLAPWVVNLHVKDYVVHRLPHLMGFLIEGRSAGEGELDIPWLLDVVRAHETEPISVILEQWPSPEPDLAATVAKEAAWAEAGIRYLRRFISD